MKATLRTPRRLLGGLFHSPQSAPALEVRRLPLAPTFPVRESEDPMTSRFLGAIRDHETLTLYYHGGSSPGILRRFLPTELYRHSPGGPIIAGGHCMLRGSTRTLRLDRVRLA
jgi:predicted DNA-binding transcriptional regulator YafY